MKKTIFLVGKLYDLSTKTANEIEADVQSRLDAHYGSNYVIFRINICKQSKEVTMSLLPVIRSLQRS